jgi:hypothetical protein
MRLLTLILVVLLSGCATVDKIETVTIEEPKTPLNLPNPTPLKLDKFKWFVVTESSSSTVFTDLKSKGIDPVLFAVTDDGYETLSINVNEIKAYLIKMRTLLDEYRNYYEPKGQVDEGRFE